MSVAKRLMWLPNAITAVRMIMALPVFLTALNGAWALGFWLLVFALTTDFFDGLAAKKLNAKSKFGEKLDPLADSSLVVAGMVGLSLSGYLSWWFTLAVLLFGATVGNEWFYRAKTPKGLVVQKMASVCCLFLAWTGIAWFYAGLAFGWHWWYIGLTFVVLLVSASLKRHRLRAWLGVR